MCANFILDGHEGILCSVSVDKFSLCTKILTSGSVLSRNSSLNPKTVTCTQGCLQKYFDAPMNQCIWCLRFLGCAPKRPCRFLLMSSFHCDRCCQDHCSYLQPFLASTASKHAYSTHRCVSVRPTHLPAPLNATPPHYIAQKCFARVHCSCSSCVCSIFGGWLPFSFC